MTDSVSHGPTIVARFCFAVTLDVLSDVTSPKQAPESAAGRYVFEITEFSGKENGAPFRTKLRTLIPLKYRYNFYCTDYSDHDRLQVPPPHPVEGASVALNHV
ncbi:MAG: hypothetical protein J0H71_00005, partial [Rhizobiales bacterium]|nr:hypothetical protein [Hyphomicrobiales bacterium]